VEQCAKAAVELDVGPDVAGTTSQNLLVSDRRME
jgi:hypothetical protein